MNTLHQRLLGSQWRELEGGEQPMLEVKKGVGYTFVSCASCLTKSCMYFNPPSLVLKARVPIMPKAILAGPSNDAALQYYVCLWMLYRFF